MSSAKESFADRFYRGLLRILPFDFRSEFGGDMEETFREQRAATIQRQGSLGLFRMWWATITDIVRMAPREHLSVLAHDTLVLTIALPDGKRARVYASSGSFHPEPEWSENILHPVEQTRGHTLEDREIELAVVVDVTQLEDAQRAVGVALDQHQVEDADDTALDQIHEHGEALAGHRPARELHDQVADRSQASRFFRAGKANGDLAILPDDPVGFTFGALDVCG